MASNDTKAKIAYTLRTMIGTEPFEKIKVADLAEAAGISRQTFYYHFTNMFDVYRWVIDRDRQYLDQSKTGLYAPSPFMIVVDICQAAYRNKELTLAFLTGGYEADMRKVLRETLYSAVRSNMEYVSDGEFDRKSLDNISYFFADGCIGIIANWAYGGMSASVEEVCAIIAKTFGNILHPEIFGKMKGNEITDYSD